MEKHFGQNKVNGRARKLPSVLIYIFIERHFGAPFLIFFQSNQTGHECAQSNGRHLEGLHGFTLLSAPFLSYHISAIKIHISAHQLETGQYSADG